MPQPYKLKRMVDPVGNPLFVIIRNEDHAYIPPDPLNRDYAAYLEWKSAGNEPDPAEDPA